ncbi:LamG-like jellyroll fold domain-containing protein [Planctomycetota bacterium]
MVALGLRPKATLGVILNYDATFDTDGDDSWEDTIGTRPGKDSNQATPNRFNFGLGHARRHLSRAERHRGRPDPLLRQLRARLQAQRLPGPGVVADLGGNTNGSAFWMDDSVLNFDVKSGSENARIQFDLAGLSAREQGDFLHVIGVADLDGEKALLYINGVLAAEELANGDLVAWAGGNDIGLGAVAGNMAFDEQGNFTGQIALFRLYGSALSAEDVAANFDSLQPEPTTLALLGLGALALLRRRRRS